MFSLSLAYVLIVITLYEVHGKIYVNVINDGENSALDSFLYYDDALQNFTGQLTGINRENHMIRRQLDTLNLRVDGELRSQKDQLMEIKTTLEEKANAVTVKAPTSCAEALPSNIDHTHGGVFRLHLPNLPPFDVFCLKDPDNGKAWTIVQRRLDGTIDFYRDWVDYKYGFGNLYGEFWLGLEKLHALTDVGKQELWIYLEDFDGEVREAKYDAFGIGDEKSKYTLHTLGKFRGDAGDSMRYHANQKFSTKDSDNDADAEGSCSITYTGAWWFKECSNVDLNGKYLYHKEDKEVKEGKGVEWYTWRGHYSLKKVFMAIRPV